MQVVVQLFLMSGDEAVQYNALTIIKNLTSIYSEKGVDMVVQFDKMTRQ